jgi:hypothetical protein
MVPTEQERVPEQELIRVPERALALVAAALEAVQAAAPMVVPEPEVVVLERVPARAVPVMVASSSNIFGANVSEAILLIPEGIPPA